MNSFKVAAIASLAALLIGCNSSDSEDNSNTDNEPDASLPGTGATVTFWQEGPDPSQTASESHSFSLSGVVAFDAPVAGAEVCIDTSRTFTCDTDNPTAVTAEDGSYTLTAEVPYPAAEFFVLAKFPTSEVSEGRDAAAVLSEGDTITLSARGYYQGAVNPLTTLEALQYDPSLSYFKQVERYAIARLMVNDLYEIPLVIDAADAFSWAAQNGITAADIGEFHNGVFTQFEEAQSYIEGSEAEARFKALNLIANRPPAEHLEAAAQWFGYREQTDELSSAQQQLIESSALTLGRQVSLNVVPDFIEVRNQNTDELVEVERYAGSLYLNEYGADEYTFVSPQACWNEAESDWVVSDGELNNFSEPRLIGDNTYALTNNASGQELRLQFTALSPNDPLYDPALHGWADSLDFSPAETDGALVRGRFEFSDELCLSAGGEDARPSEAFSEMSGDEIVAVVNERVQEEGLYEVDEAIQRITLTNSGYAYDYRVIQRGDSEVLLVLAVHASPMGSYPLAWAWREGEREQVTFMSADRMNTGYAGISQFVLTDAAATDIAEQLRQLVSNR